jgi:hypothetical protein
VKRKGKTSSAFTKIRAGLEDAIAFHAGDRQLTVRDVELKPPAPMGAKEVLAVRRMRVSQPPCVLLNEPADGADGRRTPAVRPMRR